MDVTVHPSTLSGVLPAISSKSIAHRLLILAALTDHVTQLGCNTTSEDIDATAACMRALGAHITRTKEGFRVVGRAYTHTSQAHTPTEFDVNESGSTLRFLIPTIAALGVDAKIMVHGRLAERPLEPLLGQLRAHGVSISPEGTVPIELSGQLTGGRFDLPGNVSSQYVSGLMLAATKLSDPTEIWVTQPVESRPYIDLTIDALSHFGFRVHEREEHALDKPATVFAIDPAAQTPDAELTVEGDWSNAAFWLAAGALSSEGVTVSGLNLQSAQGDRAILAALSFLGARIARKGMSARATKDHPHAAELDVSDFPDLVPPLAAVAAKSPGTTLLKNAGRLRLKESDRLATVSAALRALGVDACIEGDTLRIQGTDDISGGTVDAAHDHRIAMMAAILGAHAQGPVRILGADCVSKSYPDFFLDFARIGGIYSREDA